MLIVYRVIVILLCHLFCQWANRRAVRTRARPQGLKPILCGDRHGTAEAVPLSKTGGRLWRGEGEADSFAALRNDKWWLMQFVAGDSCSLKYAVGRRTPGAKAHACGALNCQG
jgi:hypothetical protein